MARIADQLGLPLLGWQRRVLRQGLEHDRKGQLAYRTVMASTPRQSGKSVMMLALVVAKLLASPGTKIGYRTQTRLMGRVKLLDDWWGLLGRSPLGARFHLTRATGFESLRADNGSVLYLLGDTASGAHGLSLDMVILDEAWALGADAEQATRPTLATKDNGQVWMISTAGDSKATWWRNQVDRGRAAAEMGVTDSVCYLEWSAADDADVTDPAAWPGFMPALGRLISERTVAADLQAMELVEFRRCFANQWVIDLPDQGWVVVSEADWDAVEEPA